MTQGASTASIPGVKSAVIVGASRGLGLSLVKTLVARDLGVVALYRDPSRELEELARGSAGALEIHEADVRREEDFQRVAERLSLERRFELLVYNAAVHLEHDRTDLEHARLKDVLETLDVNAVGAVRAMKHLAPFVSKSGLVVFISSEAGSLENNRRASEYGYCMSKAALNMFARLFSVREQKRASGVRVLCMHPGWLRTEMGGPNADIGPDEAARDIAETLLAQRETTGASFVDRFGKAMAW